MSYVGKNCEKDQILDATLEYVQEYNGIRMQNVVLLASSSYFDTNEAFLHELIHSKGMWNIQIAFMTTTGNISKLERLTRLIEFPTAAIFVDFETSEDTRNAFFTLRLQMKNKVLVLGFSKNFHSHHAFDIALNALISKYPNSLASFSLNTRVHAITKINE